MNVEAFYVIVVVQAIIILALIIQNGILGQAIKVSYPSDLQPLLGDVIGMARHFAERTATPLDDKVVGIAEVVLDMPTEGQGPPAG